MVEKFESAHIHIRGTGEDTPFKGKGGGHDKRRLIIPNRAVHADSISKDLSQALSDLGALLLKQKDYDVPINHRGKALRFNAARGVRLDLGDMKQKPHHGIALLNVSKRRSDGGANQAIIWLTEAGHKSLLKALGRYAAWDEFESDRKPMRFWLFETTSRVTAAKAVDFISVRHPGELSRKRIWEVTIDPYCERAFSLWQQIKSVSCIYQGKTDGALFAEIEADEATLDNLVIETGALLSINPASSFNSTFIRMDPEERRSHIDTFLEHLTLAPGDAPSTVILDTMVNRNNRLLRGSLPQARFHILDVDWENLDSRGHGTQMAGIALFGDIAQVLDVGIPHNLVTGLEAVAIVEPPTATRAYPPRPALIAGVEAVERMDGQRVFCLAATVSEERTDGVPSNTAETLDNLAWNDGKSTRLFCVAVGNVPPNPYDMTAYSAHDYDSRNIAYPLESPSQAFNVLSIGSTTFKYPFGRGAVGVAPIGDLCPTSRTALSWPEHGPIAFKPDICMEGGNHILDPNRNTSRFQKELTVMTTGHDPGLFSSNYMTRYASKFL
ncbi:MAG: S8 family serine peptidase, partial [Rhodospirillaceae bacterium]